MIRVKRCLALALLAGLFISVASADVINFQWSTTGSVQSAPGLTFAGVTDKTGSTSTGALSVNLGRLRFTGASGGSYSDSGDFTLAVTFSMPVGVYSPDSTYEANFAGTYHRYTADSATVKFADTSNDFTFTSLNGATGTGSFTLALAANTYNLDTRFNTSATVYGDITAATFTADPPPPSDPGPELSGVPEPASIALLGTLLSGAMFVLRKKRV